MYTRVRYTRGSSHPRPSSTTRLPDSLTLPSFPGELVASPVVKSVKRNPPTYSPPPPRDNFPTTPRRPRIENYAWSRYNRASEFSSKILRIGSEWRRLDDDAEARRGEARRYADTNSKKEMMESKRQRGGRVLRTRRSPIGGSRSRGSAGRCVPSLEELELRLTFWRVEAARDSCIYERWAEAGGGVRGEEAAHTHVHAHRSRNGEDAAVAGARHAYEEAMNFTSVRVRRRATTTTTTATRTMRLLRVYNGPCLCPSERYILRCTWIYIYMYTRRVSWTSYTRTFQRLTCPRTCYRPAIETDRWLRLSRNPLRISPSLAVIYLSFFDYGSAPISSKSSKRGFYERKLIDWLTVPKVGKKKKAANERLTRWRTRSWIETLSGRKSGGRSIDKKKQSISS